MSNDFLKLVPIKGASNTKTKIDPLIKKFGHPKFKNGDKVTTSISGKNVYTIDGEAWNNGFSWMYNFKESESSIGQSYITKQP